MKLFRNKRGDGTIIALPMATVVEVVIIVVTIIAFAAFSKSVYEETRPYQFFHARDMALLQASLTLPSADVSLQYHGAGDIGKFSQFYYNFERPYYVNVIHGASRLADPNAQVQSYISFLPASVHRDTGVFTYPSSLYFTRQGDYLFITEEMLTVEQSFTCDETLPPSYTIFIAYDDLFEHAITSIADERHVIARNPQSPDFAVARNEFLDRPGANIYVTLVHDGFPALSYSADSSLGCQLRAKLSTYTSLLPPQKSLPVHEHILIAGENPPEIIGAIRDAIQ